MDKFAKLSHADRQWSSPPYESSVFYGVVRDHTSYRSRQVENIKAQSPGPSPQHRYPPSHEEASHTRQTGNRRANHDAPVVEITLTFLV
jgi:hypothetical protein